MICRISSYFANSNARLKLGVLDLVLEHYISRNHISENRPIFQTSFLPTQFHVGSSIHVHPHNFKVFDISDLRRQNLSISISVWKTLSRNGASKET